MIDILIILETCFVNNVHTYIVMLQLVTMKSLAQNLNALKIANFFP